VKRETTKAVIIKRLNFGEADRILTVITPEQGLLSLLVKGVRKPKSKLSGGLELFSISDIGYIDGKSDLKTVVSTQIDVHFKNVVKDIKRTMLGYEIMKYTALYAEHSRENNFFDLLRTSLEELNDDSLRADVVYSWFILQLLQMSGSGINLEKPLMSKAFDSSKNYEFSFDDMSFYENKNGDFSATYIKFLRLLVTSSSSKTVAKVTQLEEVMEKITVFLPQLIKYVNQGK
jgi:DNA repair protein RecO